MLHRSVRELLVRSVQHLHWPDVTLVEAARSDPAASLAQTTTRALSRFWRYSSSNGDAMGCQTPTPGIEALWGQRAYSTVFRKVEALQQGMTDMVHDVVTLPSDIRYEDLVVNRAEHLKEKPRTDSDLLKFGAVYTDHMLQVAWKDGLGWMAPSIAPLAPLTLHPCAQVLHYGVECFEGMKAYKGKDGRLRLFRPDMNLDRMLCSATRLTLPQFDKTALLECIKELVRVERDWVPDQEGFSVYIRPTLIGTHPFLGMCTPREALLFVILSPVGPYFPTGLKPIKLSVETENIRAFPGGVGDKKIGGNYAPTLLPQMRASQRGCSQVLYVLQDGLTGGGLVGESGAMNIFFLFKEEGEHGGMELVTAPLDGLILPGVTRNSVLALARGFGNLKVSERQLRFDEIEDAAASGRLVEVFGSGTACVIQPVTGLLKDDDTEISIPFDSEAAAYWVAKLPGSTFMEPSLNEPFSLCGRLTRVLYDLQYGHVDSDWSVVIDK